MSTGPVTGRTDSGVEDLPGQPSVAAVRGIEERTELDGAVRAVQPLADRLIASPGRRHLLHGTWLGHAVHPVLSDVPIGLWTSALVLDLTGGASARDAARRLVGLGIAAAAPTAVTGVAEWAVAGRREQRVGVVHAAANGVALSLYTSSFLARRAGRHRLGAALGTVGAAALGFGGFLGGHLVSARKVSTRHPAFETPTESVTSPSAAPTPGGGVS